MRTSIIALALALTLSAAPLAYAQQAPGGQPSAPVTVSDDDLETFATIYVDLLDTAKKLEADMQAARTEEQALEIRTKAQTESIAKVERRGWTPEKFNSVSEAINRDPALTERAVALIETR